MASDGGLILVREMVERRGLSALMERHLSDPCHGKNVPLPLSDLLRQSISSRLGAAGFNSSRSRRLWRGAGSIYGNPA